MGRRRDRRKRGKRIRLVLALSLLLMAAGMLSGVRYVTAEGTPQAEVVPVKTRPLSGAATAETEGSAAGEIVVLEEQEPKLPLVVIDPGHGGVDEGCSGQGAEEKTVNLQIAQNLALRLQELGIDVKLTREDDETDLSLENRVEMAHEWDADIFVSIHQNACEDDVSAEGIETWYNGDGDSRRLATLVNQGAVRETGARDRGLIESDELYVLRESGIPACLIETGFLTAQEEGENVVDPAYQDKVAAGIAWGIQLYFYPKTMYLTFDDGPSEENTGAVLDILKEHDIHATFFVVGENVRKHPEIARRIVEEGHTIGIHCNRHSYEELYESVDSYLADFEEAYQAVYEVTGVEVELFRFPGGSINSYNKEVYQDIIEEMTDRGFVYFDWNASLEDAARNTTPQQLLENAKQSTLGRKKVVMLAHDIVYNTTLCLEDLIEQFPEYQMKPLTSDVAPITF